MKVVFTSAALADLDDILAYTAAKYPALLEPVESTLSFNASGVGPKAHAASRSDQMCASSPYSVIPLRFFYRIDEDRVEILHIHHTSRDVSGVDV